MPTALPAVVLVGTVTEKCVAAAGNIVIENTWVEVNRGE